MSKLLKAEFYKLFHSWYFWGTGVFNLVLSTVLLLDSRGETANLFAASLYNVPILYFLVLVFSALFVGNDFGQRTLQTYLCVGHGRGQVLFAKMLVYQIACGILLGVPLLLHGGFGALFLKGTFVPAEGDLNIIFITAAAFFAMNTLPFFFSVLFRDIGKAFAVPLVLFFLMIFLMNGEQSRFVSEILPLGQLRRIALQQLTMPVVQAACLDFLWIGIFCFGAYFEIRRADLK